MVLGSATTQRRAAVLAAALALLALGAPAEGASAAGSGVFVTPCGFSHRAPDDPIVAPGRFGASHSHDFMANAATAADSTHASLLAGPTRCHREADTAAYWVPTLSDGARPLAPARAQIYYRAPHADRAAIVAFPPDLRMIAGEARASGPQPTKVVNWHCGPAGGPSNQPVPPACPPEGHLVLQVRFPECWDGRNADAPDHRSHMSYLARKRRCPQSHPVPVPKIVLNVHYPTAGGSGVTLSSGPPSTAHADFLNSWDQAELERLVGHCLRTPGTSEAPPCRPAFRSGALADRRGTRVSSHGGLTAWSKPDRRGRWHLVLDDGAGPRHAGVRTRPAPFDVDLGPAADGRTLAVYSRCSAEPRLLPATAPLPAPATGRGCDLHRYDPATRREERIPGASSEAASEFLPTLHGDRIAFARVYERRPRRRGVYPYLYVRPLSGGRSQRMPGGGRGTTGLPGPTGLDLDADHLAIAWGLEREAGGQAELRVDPLAGGRRLLDRSGYRQSVAAFVGPALAPGSVIAGFQRSLAAGGAARSLGAQVRHYPLSGGAPQSIEARGHLVSIAAQGHRTWVATVRDPFAAEGCGYSACEVLPIGARPR